MSLTSNNNQHQFVVYHGLIIQNLFAAVRREVTKLLREKYPHVAVYGKFEVEEGNLTGSEGTFSVTVKTDKAYRNGYVFPDVNYTLKVRRGYNSPRGSWEFSAYLNYVDANYVTNHLHFVYLAEKDYWQVFRTVGGVNHFYQESFLRVVANAMNTQVRWWFENPYVTTFLAEGGAEFVWEFFKKAVGTATAVLYDMNPIPEERWKEYDSTAHNFVFRFTRRDPLDFDTEQDFHEVSVKFEHMGQEGVAYTLNLRHEWYDHLPEVVFCVAPNIHGNRVWVSVGAFQRNRADHPEDNRRWNFTSQQFAAQCMIVGDYLSRRRPFKTPVVLDAFNGKCNRRLNNF